MATNKRKDAAALFELIDKSTLKVPKSAGALKIPKWWSSKSNPTSTATTTVDTSHRNGASNGHTTGTPARAATTSDTHAAEVAPAQHRLFEPPPASATPAKPPSIRPPAPPATTAAERESRSTAPLSSTAAIQQTAPDLGNAGEEEESSPPSHRPFAPLTHPQSAHTSRPWSPPRAGAFARLPGWVIVAGIAAVVIVVTCLYLILSNGGKKIDASGSAQNPPPHVIPRENQTGSQSLIPLPSRNANSGGPVVRNNQQIAPRNPEPPQNSGSAGGGHVFAPGAVSRSADLLYIVVASTPDPSIAEKNANWIAEHGVDVSIERQNRNNRILYTLVSVQGFASISAAEPTRIKIVEIGHLLPEFKKTKRAWDDAYTVPVVAKSPKAAG